MFCQRCSNRLGRIGQAAFICPIICLRVCGERGGVLLKAIPKDQWVKAGQSTRLLVEATHQKQAAVARAVHMTASTLSRTLNGKRHASLEDCERIDSWLLDALGEAYTPGQIQSFWFVTAGSPTLVVAEDEPPISGDRQAVLRGRSWFSVAVGFIGFLTVLLLAVAYGSRDGQKDVAESDTSGPGEVMAHCDPEIGELDPSVPSEVAGWVVPMRRVFSTALSHFNWPCPESNAYFDNGALIQQLVDRDSKRGVIIASSPTRAVILSNEQWLSYSTARSLAWLPSPGLDVGLPLRTEARPAHSLIIVDNGLLVGADPTAPHFFLPPAFALAWQEMGSAQSRLGLPLTHPFVDMAGRLLVEFQFGSIFAQGTESDSVSPVFDDSASLPRNAATNGGLVVTQDGTVWLLDGQDLHWVPTADIRTCLGREPVPIRAQAIGALHLGSTAVCSIQTP